MALFLKVTSYRSLPPPEALSKRFDRVGGTIGRAADCELALPDPQNFISRRQATIRYDEGAYYISHTGRGNPIEINARSLTTAQEVRLAEGDRLVVGDYELRVSLLPEASRVGEGSIGPRVNPSPLIEGFGEDSSDERLIDPFQCIEGPVDPSEPWPSDDRATLPLFRGSEADRVPEVGEPMPPVRPIPTHIPEEYDFLRGVTLRGKTPVEADGAPVPPPTSRRSPLPEPVAGRQAPIPDQGASAATPPSPSEPTPRATGARASTAHSPAVGAFLRGAGLPDLDPLPDAVPQFMHAAGQLLRAYTQGTMEVLMARASIKKELRVGMTLLSKLGNNPLKLSPDVEWALRYLLIPRGHGSLAPLQAVREAFENLRAHELAVMAGTRAALASLLRRLDPKELEKRLVHRSLLDVLLPLHRKAKTWDLAVKLYGEMARETEEDFQTLFGEEFVRAYEEQVRRLDDAPRRSGSGAA
jgi:type VI secretion system FHA domain protein